MAVATTATIYLVCSGRASWSIFHIWLTVDKKKTLATYLLIWTFFWDPGFCFVLFCFVLFCFGGRLIRKPLMGHLVQDRQKKRSSHQKPKGARESTDTSNLGYLKAEATT